MKNLFLIIFSIALSGCSNLIDKTPKCDDKMVISIVQEITTSKENPDIYSDILLPLFNDVYGYEYPFTDHPYNRVRQRYFIDENDQAVYSKFRELDIEIEKYCNGENISGVLSNFPELLDQYCIKFNPTYYTATLSNIRPVEIDKELKYCECSSDLIYDLDYFNHSIYYTAQLNSDGEIYVEVFKN